MRLVMQYSDGRGADLNKVCLLRALCEALIDNGHHLIPRVLCYQAAKLRAGVDLISEYIWNIVSSLYVKLVGSNETITQIIISRETLMSGIFVTYCMPTYNWEL